MFEWSMSCGAPSCCAKVRRPICPDERGEAARGAGRSDGDERTHPHQADAHLSATNPCAVRRQRDHQVCASNKRSTDHSAMIRRRGAPCAAAPTSSTPKSSPARRAASAATRASIVNRARKLLASRHARTAPLQPERADGRSPSPIASVLHSGSRRDTSKHQIRPRHRAARAPPSAPRELQHLSKVELCGSRRVPRLATQPFSICIVSFEPTKQMGLTLS